MVRFIVRPIEEFGVSQCNLDDVAGADGLLFVRDGIGVVGVGEAVRLPIDDARRWIERTTVDVPSGLVGAGPIAIGWHPFAGDNGEAIVPSVVVAVPPLGAPWVAYLDGQEEAAHEALRPKSVPRPEPSRFEIRQGVAVETYLAAVRAARDAVRAGRLTKAVIARDIVVDSSVPIDVSTLLRRLRLSFGSCYRYCMNGLVGASPELLVQRMDDAVWSHPLAGTTPRTGDPDTDGRLAAELRTSRKNQIEHRVVIDMIHDTLLPWCSYLDWQPEPEVVPVANVQHLGTRMQGTLSQPIPHVLDLVRALSPTPALGGHPRKEALELIAQHEGLDRGRYGGAVGWFDRTGDGTWAVTIRCAELSENRHTARLFAGGGIVADSDPLAELAETQAKFQAMLAAIVRP